MTYMARLINSGYRLSSSFSSVSCLRKVDVLTIAPIDPFKVFELLFICVLAQFFIPLTIISNQ
jgi:hypothetical protein